MFPSGLAHTSSRGRRPSHWSEGSADSVRPFECSRTTLSAPGFLGPQSIDPLRLPSTPRRCPAEYPPKSRRIEASPDPPITPLRVTTLSTGVAENLRNSSGPSAPRPMCSSCPPLRSKRSIGTPCAWPPANPSCPSPSPWMNSRAPSARRGSIARPCPRLGPLSGGRRERQRG